MRYGNLIRKMTLEEKAAILGGKNEWSSRNIDRLGIPSLFCSDGPNGLRKQAGAGDHLGLHASVPATCFPTSASLASSWDPELLERVGAALGEEAAAEKVNVVLGPGLNIKRNPLCGRNFEYFSEDPYLSGKLAAGMVRGIQKNGVSACIKHFAVNSQETRRMAMNAVVDERTLREIYLTGFEIAVKEGKPGAVMSSYNMVNGIYANENRHLLTEILREDWGFDGAVITDWGGSNSHTEGVRNGSTLEMPAPGFSSARELLKAVKEGSLDEKVIDQRVDELLNLVFETKQGLDSFQSPYQSRSEMFTSHHLLAETAASESAVLLRNEDQILPIEKGTKVAVIGDFAFKPRYQGAGSSLVNSWKVETVKDLLSGTEGQKRYGLDVVGFARGYDRNGQKNDALVKEATELAKLADVVLYFFGLNENSESEGLDRQHIRIPENQISLLQELAMANPNLVGVVSAGSVIDVAWHKHLKGLMDLYLTGDAGASAALDLLTGRKNPSGKLAETFLRKYEDTPSYSYYPAQERNSEYREGIYVGYRYFNTVGKQVYYPFGYGLSYTTFAYDQLEVTDQGCTFTITNTGKRAGAEIAQLYVSMEESRIFRPARELKGFVKVWLEPGESRCLTIPFDEYTFRYWNVKTGKWETEAGTCQILIGSNVENIRLRGEIKTRGTTEDLPYSSREMPCSFSGHIENMPDQEFSLLLGRPIPDGHWSGKLTRNDALCQMYYARSPLARLLYSVLHGAVDQSLKKGVPNLNALFQYNMPFRALAKMTGGVFSMDMVDGLVLLVNGHFLRGLGRLISGAAVNLVENWKYSMKLRRS